MSMTKTVKEVSAATLGSPLRGLCWCECRDRRILRKMIGRRRAGEERRREERGWRGSETRMLMRVRRRKEEGRENIDLRQENRRECNRRGLYPAWTVIRSEEGDTAAGYSAPISADISVRVCVCVFCTCIPGGEGRRTRQRREEKMLWSATCRDVERERRESQGGGGRRYVKKKMLVLRGIRVSPRSIVRMRRPCNKSYRLAKPRNFRRCRFFWQAARARRPFVKALKLKLASLLCGRAAARLK